MLSRRALITTGIKSILAVPVLGYGLLSCSSKNKNKQAGIPDPGGNLRILILGGTSFLGPHQIAHAISKGHTVTTFTRGKTEPTIHKDIFQNVEQLIGDRANDLTALENGKWDVVIDNSGHNAEWTKRSATLLKDRADLYIYTSSTGVYYPYLSNGMDEKTKVLLKAPEKLEDEEQKMEYGYGVMKANSEEETIKAFGGDRSIIVRPTYMIGPGDRSDRFIYWPLRLAKGGEIMVPGKPEDPVQYIDVRDVAEWTIRLAEEKLTGTYNAVGPEIAETMSAFINKAKFAFDVKSTSVFVDDYEFLKENKVFYIVPWIMPEGNNYGSARINNEKALAAGLTFRKLQTSIKDTYQWWFSDALTDERRTEYESKPGSLLLRENSILENWKKQIN